MKIFTHVSVDLDAVASVFGAWQFISGASKAGVEFRPANWDGTGMTEDDLALDIEAGGRGMKGEKEANGIVHSCFASIVAKYAPADDQKALASLVAFVDVQDSKGAAVKVLAPEASKQAQEILRATSVGAVLRALQAVHPQNDALVVERMSEIFLGMLQAGRSRMRAEREADRAEILPGGKVGIVVNNKEFATNGILFEERGVRVLVYVDGLNLGLIRHGEETLRMDHDAIREVVRDSGEAIGQGDGKWFAHSAGFLFCRGSRKAPATTPSKVNPRALAQAAAHLLG